MNIEIDGKQYVVFQPIKQISDYYREKLAGLIHDVPAVLLGAVSKREIALESVDPYDFSRLISEVRLEKVFGWMDQERLEATSRMLLVQTTCDGAPVITTDFAKQRTPALFRVLALAIESWYPELGDQMKFHLEQLKRARQRSR